MPFFKGHKIRNTGRTHFKKGFIPWITGKHHTEKTLKKLKEVNRGRIPWNKGTKDVMKAWNKGLKGYVNDGCFKEGHISLMKGKKHTVEARKKLSESKIGNKNPQWQGGISFEPYSVDWNETLRRSIRERDNYICQLCSQYGNFVHHKDYNKHNCNPDNLITLCNSCNIKVNYNRNYWINYFK